MIKPPAILNDLPVTKRGKLHNYPTEYMMPRESFFIPLGRRRPESVTSCIYSSIRKCQAKFVKPGQFIVRRVRENGIEGVRCWRIR